jgi:hypothetical protein
MYVINWGNWMNMAVVYMLQIPKDIASQEYLEREIPELEYGNRSS